MARMGRSSSAAAQDMPKGTSEVQSGSWEAADPSRSLPK